jgi:hypothetical protein
MEYEILHSTDSSVQKITDSLNKKIALKIKDGYLPHGSIVLTVDNSHPATPLFSMFQAMSKNMALLKTEWVKHEG